MLNRTCEYAVRALVHLAVHADEWPIPGWAIARQARIPRKYLSAVLAELVRAGILDSTPGKCGGFRMARTPAQTRLWDVVQPFEPFEGGHCPFGNKACSDDAPCAVHREWKKVIGAEQRFLKQTSVRDLAAEGKRTRRRPAKTVRR